MQANYTHIIMIKMHRVYTRIETTCFMKERKCFQEHLDMFGTKNKTLKTYPNNSKSISNRILSSLVYNETNGSQIGYLHKKLWPKPYKVRSLS